MQVCSRLSGAGDPGTDLAFKCHICVRDRPRLLSVSLEISMCSQAQPHDPSREMVHLAAEEPLFPLQNQDEER